MFFSSQPRLTPRTLADIAVVSVPSALKGPDNPVARTEDAGRLSWTFSSTYLWASMGSVTRYKQKLAVSVMDADASSADYDELPYLLQLSYRSRKQIRHEPLGTGMLTVWECVYEVSTDREPAYQYLYSDRRHRLQLAWHGVAKEADLATAITAIPRIVESFRIVRDPKQAFAEQRNAPSEAATARASRRATALAMLQRETHEAVAAGQPVAYHGAWLEWMDEPEPRYQLLLPLGRIRAAAPGATANRPRPLRTSGNTFTGSIGWREFADDEWSFMNADNAYLPFRGIGAALAKQQTDRGFMYFYYAATVRVEEEPNDTRLTSLDWFFGSVPEIQRRWRDGTLVGPGSPERE